MDFSTWLEKYGLAVGILVSIATFFVTSVWPLMIKWVKMAESRADTAEQFLKDQIKAGQEQVLRSENRNQTICDNFVVSLKQISENQVRLVDEFRRLEDALRTKARE